MIVVVSCIIYVLSVFLSHWLDLFLMHHSFCGVGYCFLHCLLYILLWGNEKIGLFMCCFDEFVMVD